MSALHPKADMCGATWDVRFVPIADIASNRSRAEFRFAVSMHSQIRPHFYNPDVTAVVINGLNCFLERNFVFTLQRGDIYYAVNRLPDGLLCPYRLVINTASSFVRRGAPTGRARANKRGLALTEPIFDCRVYQRGAEWHWQVINGFEHVLASGVAESDQEARNAALLQCLKRLSNRSGPN